VQGREVERDGEMRVERDGEVRGDRSLHAWGAGEGVWSMTEEE
jgi:hypothetical protein